MRNMVIEKAASSPMDKNIGYLVMSKNLHRASKEISVLVFLTKLEKNSYHPVKEIGSFIFQNYEQARQFIDYLPNMTAIDLMALQSGPAVLI